MAIDEVLDTLLQRFKTVDDRHAKEWALPDAAKPPGMIFETLAEYYKGSDKINEPEWKKQGRAAYRKWRIESRRAIYEAVAASFDKELTCDLESCRSAFTVKDGRKVLAFEWGDCCLGCQRWFRPPRKATAVGSGRRH